MVFLTFDQETSNKQYIERCNENKIRDQLKKKRPILFSSDELSNKEYLNRFAKQRILSSVSMCDLAFTFHIYSSIRNN